MKHVIILTFCILTGCSSQPSTHHGKQPTDGDIVGPPQWAIDYCVEHPRDAAC